MLCPEAVERLPELLNGTLAEAERVELEMHLAGCAACRKEWDETRLGARVFESHLPVDVLTALAWETPLAGFDADVARGHLAGCADCAEDLALARECHARAPEGASVAPSARRRWLRSAGSMAALAAVFVGGLLLGSFRAERGFAPERRATVEQVSRLNAESERLRQAEAELRARISRLQAPQPNLPLVELFPGLARDVSGREPLLTLAPADTLAALVFSAPGADPPLAVELRDEQGKLLWAGRGLRPNPLGGYVLGVPAELLPDGRFRLLVKRERGAAPVTTLAFRVLRPR